MVMTEGETDNDKEGQTRTKRDIQGQRQVNYLNLTNNKKSFPDHSVRTGSPIIWNSLEEKIKNSSLLSDSVIN